MIATPPARRIAIVTDAWHPQVNGVVRTLDTVIGILRARGHEVLVIAPDQFRSMPCPTYPEIRLAFVWPARIGAMLTEFAPDAIHLSTEGPLCIAARHYCVAQDLAFTTAYHTQFPDYVARRTGVSAELIWPAIRRFHRRAQRVMASTCSMAEELTARGIGPIAMWGRGVDTALFRPDAASPALYADLPRPIHLYEIQHDQPADSPQHDLPSSFPRRLQIDQTRGFLAPAAGGKAAGIDVYRGQPFGLYLCAKA